MSRAYLLLTITLLFSDSHANVDMPIATGCQESANNIWDCKIQSSNTEIFKTRLSLVEQPRQIIVQSKYVKQLLNSQTVASPGPGRGAWTWSSRGLSDLLKNPSNTTPRKSIENIEDLYGMEKQQASLKVQCGGTSDIPWFGSNPKKSETYFVRGHYAPNADYQTDEGKRGTFHYFNAAPQWQRFNNGNWKNKVESPIQKLIKDTTISYEIYSGSYGQLECPNHKGTSIYIKNETPNANKIHVEIPIPKVFFKIITPHVLQTPQKPIFIATINHPTMNRGQIEEYLEEHFCTTAQDICDKIPDRSKAEYTWFRPSGFLCEKAVTGNSRSVVEAGYTYACEATPAIQDRLGIKLSSKSTVQVVVPPHSKKVRIGS